MSSSSRDFFLKGEPPEINDNEGFSPKQTEGLKKTVNQKQNDPSYTHESTLPGAVSLSKDAQHQTTQLTSSENASTDDFEDQDELELQQLTASHTHSVSDRRKRWRMAAKTYNHHGDGNAASNRPETSNDLDVPDMSAAQQRDSLGSNMDMSSHRSSMDSRLSHVDMAKVQSAMLGAGLAGDVGENKEQQDQRNHTHGADAYIKSVIPALPMWMALICLLLNICLPGFGEFFYSLLIANIKLA